MVTLDRAWCVLCALTARKPAPFEKFFVFKLRWALLAFAFWPRQEAGFEASERNKDASHAPTAHKLAPDALYANHMAAVPALPSQN
jgi:hypothetical protein